MKKRKLLAIIIALTLWWLLCSCTTQPQTSETDSQSVAGTFTVVAKGWIGNYAYQMIMYDPDTMVMYTYLDGSDAGTISVLYNADGTLKLYSPEH